METGAAPPGEPMGYRARPGMTQRAVASEKPPPVGGPRRLGPAEIGKSDARAELAPPRVTREQRARLLVDLGDDERRGGRSRHAKDPLDVGGHGQPPRPSRLGRQSETRDLSGVVERHQLYQF